MRVSAKSESFMLSARLALTMTVYKSKPNPKEIVGTSGSTCKIESCLDPEEYQRGNERIIFNAELDLEQRS